MIGIDLLIKWLLANWKIVLIATLLMSSYYLFNLWRSEVKAFNEFKAAIVVLGKEAEKETKRINDLHDKVLKETSDEWNKQLPKIRDIAIDNYMRRFPRGLCGNTGSSEMPGKTDNTETPNGTKSERVAPGETAKAGQDDFVVECAKDAGKLKSLRYWVIQNKIPVEK